MDLRPALQIQTVIKALTDVILPAVDPNNKLAQEQTRLAIGTLHLVAQRQPQMFRYDCDELSRLLTLADTLTEQAGKLQGVDQALHALKNSAEAGSNVLDRAGADPAELEAANFNLREKVGTLITEMYAANDLGQLKHISATVTAHANEQLLRERAWLVKQGWEADPQALPSVESLIGTAPGAR